MECDGKSADMNIETTGFVMMWGLCLFMSLLENRFYVCVCVEIGRYEPIRFIYKSLNNDDLLTFRRNDYFNKVAHIYGWSQCETVLEPPSTMR